MKRQGFSVDLFVFLQEPFPLCRIKSYGIGERNEKSAMTNNRLGIRIRALRRLKRMTQQQMAERLSLSASQLSNIERGLKEPNPDLMEKMANVLDIPREELFIISEEVKKHSLQ